MAKYLASFAFGLFWLVLLVAGFRAGLVHDFSEMLVFF